MHISLTITTLAALLLSTIVHAKTETPSLHRGLKGGNKNGPDNYFAIINSAEQGAPTCKSSALNSGNVVATVRADLFCIKLSYNGLTSGPELVSNVHGPAAVGATGPVIFTIDTSTEKTQCFELTNDQKRDLEDELWYINIHSDECPNDTIRGQILPLVSNVGTIVKQLRQISQAEAVAETRI